MSRPHFRAGAEELGVSGDVCCGSISTVSAEPFCASERLTSGLSGQSAIHIERTRSFNLQTGGCSFHCSLLSVL